MSDIHIQKVQTRYRLPPSLLNEQRRLDQLTRIVVGAACAEAMRRLGLTDESELCVRSVFVPVSLRLNTTDKSLIDHWSAALAGEIADTIRRGSTRRVVAYQSRRQALIDLAQCVARGDLRRRWAWRQLGLWQSAGVTTERLALVELVRSLCNQPALIVPTFNALATSGELQMIARRLTEEQWTELAAAALSETGRTQVLDRSSGASSPSVMREVWRVIDRSSIFRAIASALHLAETGEAIRRSIAVLAVLDVQPTLLRSKSASTLIGTLAEVSLVERPDGGPTSGFEDMVSEEFASDSPETHARSKVDLGPKPLNLDPGTDPQPLDLRQRAFTRYGGLLFLLSVFEDLNLPEVILDHPVLGTRHFQWVLHQLALAIVNLAPEDPAALAFAGLSPNARPPSLDEEAANEIETAALRQLVTTIVERLQSLLQLEDETDVIEFVCRRRAEVVADPGWIEVKLSLDEVSPEVRRAGLDLDPGYVSWLGVVLRFVYE